MQKSLSEQELKSFGLDARDIAIHQRRIIAGLGAAESTFIKILDTCRLDNHGILPKAFYKGKLPKAPEGYVAFVPAAGAASRYFQPLQSLRSALIDQDSGLVEKALQSLKQQNADLWPLPAVLKRMIADFPKRPETADFSKAIAEIDSPKALLPFQKDGASFLQKKSDEHSKLKGLVGEIFVAPLNQSQVFAEHLGGHSQSEYTPFFMEQGAELSTIRFTRDGSPYRDESGAVSVVPAGHGMLVRLFPDIRRKVPNAHSLFIRNIDNVIINEKLCLADTELFLKQHQEILRQLSTIRRRLQNDLFTQAARSAELLRMLCVTRHDSDEVWLEGKSKELKSLWRLLFELFHCPEHLAEELSERVGEKAALRQLYNRPLNSLGQVPNNGKDVGGSPVRAVHGSGEVSICLELPHANDIDRKFFLENPKVATHFNPVFVAAEIPADNAVYDLEQCPFWILANKNIHGTAVVYHEIVLYEVLGNSYTANVLFPEIPRHLFHPHKTLLDGLKK